MAGKPEIQIEGLKEVRREVNKLAEDNAWKQELKAAYSEVASRVEATAKNKASGGSTTVGGSSATMGGAAVATIKGKGTTTFASLQGGSARVPWFYGWNFGTTGAFRQFPFREEPDLALYSAIKEEKDGIVESFADAVGDALERAFPG